VDADARIPGGLWHRYAAWSLDFAGIAALAWLATGGKVQSGVDAAAVAWKQLYDRAAQAMADGILGGQDLHAMSQSLLHDTGMRAAAGAMQDGIERATLPFALACAGIALLWHGLGEATRWQGSPGKRAFGLVVTDLDGQPPGIARAFARQVAGLASWLTLNLGHLLAALPPQYRALHDRIAGARVLRVEATTRMPRAAKLWLWLQVLGGLLALFWGLSRYFAMLASIG
jgi:uncharacterized RDD family membrane protein YckC